MSRNKREVEETKILDINIFKSVCKRGSDTGDYRWWLDGTPNGKIGYSIKMYDDKSGILDLSYIILSHSDSIEDKHFNYSIEICSTKCNYGGYRYWMRCPLIHNGVKCNRRVEKLYLGPDCDYFGCRHCLDLTYESKSKNYHLRKLYGFTKVYDFMEYRDKIKRFTYNGKLTKKAVKLLAMDKQIRDLYDDLEGI